ncbi:MAG: carbon starvation protein A, partial [Verrucomicrobiota bacterium]
ARKRLASLHESEPVWLPDYAVVESKPTHIFSTIALAFTLAKELSGEAAVERACTADQSIGCAEHQHHTDVQSDPSESAKTSLEKSYVQETERRFNGSVNRCC